MVTLRSLWNTLCYDERDGRRTWSTTKVEVWSALMASVILFATTAGVQSTEHSLTTFFLAIATVIPLSVVVRVATEDLTVRCQQNQWEVAAGLTRALLGYHIPSPPGGLISPPAPQERDRNVLCHRGRGLPGSTGGTDRTDGRGGGQLPASAGNLFYLRRSAER